MKFTQEKVAFGKNCLRDDSKQNHQNAEKPEYRLRWLQTCLLVIIVCCYVNTAAATKPMVALDCYHNNETSAHYTWGLTDNNNYSQFAGVIVNLGGDTMSIHTALDSAALINVNVLVIVDPDTTTENANAKYISSAETAAVDKWVQRGGIVMLLANNKGNCEFTHLNELSSQFGIRFNGDTYSSEYDLTPLPSHAFFTGCTTLHIKDISTLTVTTPAQAVLTLTSKVLMATATKGKGTVFAVGDPWLYNEYINTKDNKKAATNVMQWLFARIPASTSVVSHVNLHNSSFKTATGDRMYFVNGRAVRATIARQTDGILCTPSSKVIVSKVGFQSHFNVVK